MSTPAGLVSVHSDLVGLVWPLRCYGCYRAAGQGITLETVILPTALQILMFRDRQRQSQEAVHWVWLLSYGLFFSHCVCHQVYELLLFP